MGEGTFLFGKRSYEWRRNYFQKEKNDDTNHLPKNIMNKEVVKKKDKIQSLSREATIARHEHVNSSE